MDNSSVTGKYNILINGDRVHQNLSRDEFFDIMEDLAQIPWDGKLNYDWQLWIDSDIVFNTEKLIRLDYI